MIFFVSYTFDIVVPSCGYLITLNEKLKVLVKIIVKILAKLLHLKHTLLVKRNAQQNEI